MKRILLLSLLLLPIVALAQYPTFSNKQKLGVQTTGDGLIYRGGIHPNYYTPSNINNAYFYLDTTTSKLYLYSATAWQQVYPTASDTLSLGAYLLKSDTLAMLLPYLKKSDTISLSNRINNKLSLADTASMLLPYLKLADTTSMLTPYFRDSDTTMLNLITRFNSKLNTTDTVSLSNRIDLKLNKTDTINLSNRIDIKLNASDTVSLSNRINKKLDTLYVNYQTNVDLLTNKDTINITPLEAGAGINITNNIISLDTTLLDSVVRVQNVYVKNGTGTVLNKGEAVYVTGANGTNIIVGRASNVAESSSSKTLGLTMTSIAINGFGYVVKEGLLAGLNTDAATAGDPIWLSNIPGGLIFGLANKPYAPNHLVYLGIVTRKQTNNGEVYVTVQNGFEIKELHDVQIIDPENKASLYYNSSQNLWRDTTAALLVSDTASMLSKYVNTYSNQININGNKTFNNTVNVDSLNSTKQAKIQSLTVGKGGYSIIGGTPGGISSTAFGFEALKNNTIGDWNTAMGYQTLLNNTTGEDNVAIGYNTLKFNTTGRFNTAIGSFSLDLNIIGDNNTTIGYNAGNGSRGNNNIFIGSNSGHLDSFVNNVLVLGSAASPLLTGILSGNKKLGINKNPLTLTHTFEVNSPISDAVKISSNTNSTNLELANNSGNSVFIKSSNKNMVLQTDTTALMYLNGDNKKVGILTMNPQQELEVAGNVRIDSLNNNIVPTRMVGSSNNGDLTNVNLGEGLSFVNDTLKVDLTIIDTAIAASSITLIGNVSGSGSTNSPVTTTIGNGVVTNDMLAGSISDSKLNTITTAGKISNSATTATSTNTNSAIVTRDGSGNFSAGIITASLNGNASTATNVAYSGLTGTVPTWNQNTTGNAATVTSVLPSNFASQTANTVLAAPNGSSGTPTFRSLVSSDIPSLNYLLLTGGVLSGALTGTTGTFTGLNVNNTNVNGEGILTLKSYNFNFANKIQFGDGAVIRREIIYPNSSSNMQFRSYTVGGSSGGYDFYVSNGSTESLAATIGTDKSLSLTGTLGVTSNITANSFIKSGGTFNQFLKADGTVDGNDYLTTSSAASIYYPKIGGTISGTINRQEGLHDGSASTFYYNILNYFARRDNNKSGQTAQITFTDRPGTSTFPNNVRTSDIYLMTAKNFSGGQLGQYLDTTLSVVANQDGGRIGISKLNPSYKLDVNGTLGVSGTTVLSSLQGTDTRMVVANNTGVLSTQAIPTATGTVTNVSANSTTPNGLSVATGTTTPVISMALAADGITGVVSNTTQTFTGAKTFNGNVIVSGTNTLNVGSNGTFGGRVNTPWIERSYANSTATSLTVSINTTWLNIHQDAAVTLTLPSAVTYPGKELIIKQTGAGIVSSSGTPNIIGFTTPYNGSPQSVIINPSTWRYVTLVSDGTNWVTMQRNN